MQLLETTRTDGVDYLWRWRAEVLAGAGRALEARAATTRASDEIEAKAAKLRDPDLRQRYLAARQRALR
jgi:hypothetical protein